MTAEEGMRADLHRMGFDSMLSSASRGNGRLHLLPAHSGCSALRDSWAASSLPARSRHQRHAHHQRAHGRCPPRNVLIFDLSEGTMSRSTRSRRESSGSRPLPVTPTWVARTFARAVRRLRIVAEANRAHSSFAAQTTVKIDSLLEGIAFYTSITRSRFEELFGDLVSHTIAHSQGSLRLHSSKGPTASS
ncbi:hypothetical protein CF326_g9336 [Tilletia indica]|nr:hypothetical protein CF326_g9336 [Tilletia indica]